MANEAASVNAPAVAVISRRFIVIILLSPKYWLPVHSCSRRVVGGAVTPIRGAYIRWSSYASATVPKPKGPARLLSPEPASRPSPTSYDNQMAPKIPVNHGGG